MFLISSLYTEDKSIPSIIICSYVARILIVKSDKSISSNTLIHVLCHLIYGVLRLVSVLLKMLTVLLSLEAVWHRISVEESW